MLRRWICLFLFIPFLSDAIELLPWLGRQYEIDARASLLYQNYHSVQGGHRHLKRHGDDLFFTLQGIVPRDNYSVELESTFAKTRRQNPALDNIRLAGKIELTNDIVGDFLTLTPGITITQAFRHSVHDISSFHHGKLEGEAHLSFGKEYSCNQFWYSRLWGVVGFACADTGSPWLRGDLYMDRNWWDRHQIRLFLHSLWGLGKNELHRLHDFDGYGSIRHRSIDLGMRYSYLFENGILFNIEFARRVYACNFPARANLILVGLHYTYSAQILKQFSDLFSWSSDDDRGWRDL